MARSFPDSSERSHLEHGWEGRWRYVTDEGHAFAIETAGARRATLAAAPTTRDRFWEGSGALELELWSMATWSWRTRLEGELLRYDREDSLLYLGTRVLRGRTGPRLQGAAGWSLRLAARGERLQSPRDPGEEYVETGGELAFEWFGRRGWWSLAPAAGWREYPGASDGSASVSLSGIHSSFAFLRTGRLRGPAAPRLAAPAPDGDGPGGGPQRRHGGRAQPLLLSGPA